MRPEEAPQRRLRAGESRELRVAYAMVVAPPCGKVNPSRLDLKTRNGVRRCRAVRTVAVPTWEDYDVRDEFFG